MQAIGTMGGQLRRATPDDAAAVRALVRAAYAKWIPVMGREPRPMRADYDQAVREHLVTLLIIDKSLIGVIELVVEPDAVLIENIAVLPDHTGRGYGHALMSYAREVAQSLGHKRLWLYTNKLMAENIAFYQRLGYAIDREEGTRDWGQVVYMSMSI
jgi:N-acetylglutamate synthase-like GNAT family acetyltransferase